VYEDAITPSDANPSTAPGTGAATALALPQLAGAETTSAPT